MPGMGNAAAQLQVVVGADVSQAEAGLASLGGKVNSVGSTIQTAMGAAAIGAVVGLGAAFAGSVTSAASFEQQLSAISSVSNKVELEAAGGMKALSDAALELGKATSFSASEAAAGMEELVKAGVSIQDVIGGGARAVLDLAAASGTAVPEAATVMANALNTFSLSGEHATEVANLLAGASVASATDVHQLGLGLAAVGAVAHTMGLSLDDTVTSLALFAQNGLKGSDAGTSLKTMLLNLSPSTKAATATMRNLGIITADGANQFFDAAGNMKGTADIAGVLKKALSGLTREQQINALQTMFGTDAVRAAAILMDMGTEGVNKMAEAQKAAGSAQEIATERLNNFLGALESLQGSLETAAIMIGSAFLPSLKDLAKWLTTKVNDGIEILAQIPDIIGTIQSVLDFDWSPDKSIQPFTLAVGNAVVMLRDKFGPTVKTVSDFVTGTLVPAFLAIAEPLAAFAAGFLATIAAAGVLAPIITGIVAVLGFLLTPLGAAAVAVGLLAVAWTTNFLGIRDIVSKVLSGDVKGALDLFLANLGEVAAKLGPIIASWGTAFMDFAIKVAGWIGDQIAKIDWATVWARAVGIATALGTYVLGLAVDFAGWLGQQVAKIPWAQVWAQASQLAATFGTYLLSLTVDFATWLTQQVAKIPWPTVWAAATTVATDLDTYLGTLTVDFATWLTKQVAAIPWATVWAGVVGMVEAAQVAFAAQMAKLDWKAAILAAVDAAAQMWQALTDIISRIDWATLGTSTGELMAGMVKAAIALLVGKPELSQGWAASFSANIAAADWGAIGVATAALLGKMLGAAIAAREAWTAFITGLVNGFVTSITGMSITEIQDALAAKLVSVITGAITSASTSTKTQSVGLGSAVADGISAGLLAGAGPVAAAAARLVQAALGAARGPQGADAHSPSRPMIELGMEMGAGLEEGIHNSSDSVTETMTTTLTAALKAATEAITALTKTITELITKLAKDVGTTTAKMATDVKTKMTDMATASGQQAAAMSEAVLQETIAMATGVTAAAGAMAIDVKTTVDAMGTTTTETTQTMATNVGTIVSTMSQGVSATVGGMWIDVTNRTAGATQVISATVDAFTATVLQISQKLREGVTTDATTTQTMVTKAMSDMTTSVTESVKVLADGTIEKFTEVVESAGTIPPAVDQINEAMSNMRPPNVDPIVDAFDRIGESAHDANNAVSKMIDLIGNADFQNGGYFDDFLSGRAAGGPVRGGNPYLVGEMGPELFVPAGAGRIVPHDELGGTGGGIDYARLERMLASVASMRPIVLQGTSEDLAAQLAQSQQRELLLRGTTA